MPTADELQEIRSNVFGEIRVHCPFGCTKDEADEYGYCPHLVGFTNDNKTYEPLEQQYNRFGEVIGRFVHGGKKGSNAKKILGTDVLVNPEKIVKDREGAHVSKSWVSARVYRRNVETVQADDEPEAETAKRKGK